MSQTIVNLTLPIVTEKIDAILAIYPLHSYGSPTLDHHDLRRRLTTYVLSRLPVVYMTMDSVTACTLDSPAGCYSQDQHEQISQLIYQGLEALLAQPRPRYGSQTHELAGVGSDPSSWFG